MPSIDRKTRHSSASLAYAATTRLAWRAVLSASGSTSPSSAGSDFAGIRRLYVTMPSPLLGGFRRLIRDGWAVADGRVRHNRRSLRLLLFGKADALTGVGAGAWNGAAA